METGGGADSWGGDGLLASYEVERRPIAERTIREAAANMSVLAPELGNQEMQAQGLTGEQARRAAARVIWVREDCEFHSLGLVLGYQYDASPVIVDDGTPSLPEGQDYEPTARPGARLPHMWMPDGQCHSPCCIGWGMVCRSKGFVTTLM